MFEARMHQAAIMKKIMDAIKDLVTDANLDCSGNGICLQAMDASHVSLVTLQLKPEGFESFRADRSIPLGINLAHMAKILKCAGNDDVLTMKAEDSGDNVSFMFESPQQNRVSHFSLKLLDIDAEHLGIPATEYQCVVQMPSQEFARICREISIIGDTVKISASKEGVKFQVSGDHGSGSIVCKSTPSADDENEAVSIKCDEEVSMTFALRYLNFFAKATPLSNFVTLRMSPEVPLVTEYAITTENGVAGKVCYYLAPKIEEEEEEA